jgi:hypothetical protein
MNESLKATTKAIFADKAYLAMLAAMTAATIVFVLYVLFTVEPRDIQVVTRYSELGESHFYKSKWYSMYSFAAFGIIVWALHSALMVKLRGLGRRDVGLGVGWLTLLILFMAALYSYETLNLAFFVGG